MKTERIDLTPAPREANQANSEQTAELLRRAASQIAPTWPLDRFIAVNPFWEMTDKPIAQVSAELRALSGARLLMPRAYYRQAMCDGEFSEEHLVQALGESGSELRLNDLYTALFATEPEVPRRERVLDVADKQAPRDGQVSLRGFVTHSVSQVCGAFFDAGQAQWGAPRDGGLYAFWRAHAVSDLSPALALGISGYREVARELPTSASEMAVVALSLLRVPQRECEAYLTGLLLDLGGWAATCAYRRFTAQLRAESDDTLTELLSIQLAWEWMALRLGGPSVARSWQIATASWPSATHSAHAAEAPDWIFQRALELSFRERVCRELASGRVKTRVRTPAVQAVFCIDVRSEVFRRALEATTPSVQTLGFAGFFGMPVEYQPVGADEARPQLPGLLAPRLRITDLGVPDAAARSRESWRETARSARGLKSGALSAYSFVDALGLSYALHLFRDGVLDAPCTAVDDLGLSARAVRSRKPRLTSDAAGTPLSIETKVELAAAMLRAMSLTRDFAPLVLLVGHGSRSRNNPHASALDCGACCGHSGEVNARAAAALLNEPEVRAGLGARGVSVPAHTRFLAAEHDTTGDDVRLFDLDELPSSHAQLAEQLGLWLTAASRRARAERASRHGVQVESAAQLQRAAKKRAASWSEVRPEWGLVNNAVFVVAPREHTAHMNLEGRAFLHDYRAELDPEFKVLELIMTAPMVVTHWINMQYYASTTDPLRYGSGNKVLHDVVGGNLGVFEGNGGDLRIGLPLQCVHDGKRWVHTPLRLAVFIAAPRHALEAVMHKHPKVRALVENGWLDLFQIDADSGEVNALRQGGWSRASG